MLEEDITRLKELQESVSKQSRADVTIYHCKKGQYHKLITVELLHVIQVARQWKEAQDH